MLELPTVNEAVGLKDHELIAYFVVFGVLAPAGTLANIVARLNQAINVAAGAKGPQVKFAATGLAIDPGTPEHLQRRNKADT